MKTPDGKTSLFYALAVLVVTLALATTIRALVLEFGIQVFWGGIVVASVVAGFASALVFLRDANTWALKKWAEILPDVLGFVISAAYFFAVAAHVLWFQWLAR